MKFTVIPQDIEGEQQASTSYDNLQEAIIDARACLEDQGTTLVHIWECGCWANKCADRVGIATDELDAFDHEPDFSIDTIRSFTV